MRQATNNQDIQPIVRFVMGLVLSVGVMHRSITVFSRLPPDMQLVVLNVTFRVPTENCPPIAIVATLKIILLHRSQVILLPESPTIVQLATPVLHGNHPLLTIQLTLGMN
jgi:hypothetical protein